MPFEMVQENPPEEKNEWMRLPKTRNRCPVTGLSRTSLVELLDERDPSTGDFLILQYTKKRHGKQRGIRMIHKASLLAFLRSRAEEQCRRKFASDVQNPDGVSVEQVCADFDLFVRPLLGLVGYPRP